MKLVNHKLLVKRCTKSRKNNEYNMLIKSKNNINKINSRVIL